MASINEVRLMGNLGQDPDLRYTQGGIAVCTLNLATSKSWTDQKTGEEKEQTEWHRVVVWGKAAEAVAKAKKKGDQLHVSGYLQTRKYTDAQGVEKYATEVVAGNWDFGGVKFTGRAPSNRPSHPADDAGAEPGPGARTRPAPAGGPPPDSYIPSIPGDDDIPF